MNRRASEDSSDLTEHFGEMSAKQSNNIKQIGEKVMAEDQLSKSWIVVSFEIRLPVKASVEKESPSDTSYQYQHTRSSHNILRRQSFRNRPLLRRVSLQWSSLLKWLLGGAMSVAAAWVVRRLLSIVRELLRGLLAL